MKRERGLWRRVVEQTLINHVAGAVHPLLARLEHEEDGAGEFLAPGAQYPRRADQHGRMRVVPAGVHVAVRVRSEV